MLGVDRVAARVDRVTPFPPDSLLVLFTDGLVERRDSSLDVGTARVLATVAGLPSPDAEGAADAVLAVAESGNEDDIALLVLHAR